jgi:hypothetical protein
MLALGEFLKKRMDITIEILDLAPGFAAGALHRFF